MPRHRASRSVSGRRYGRPCLIASEISRAVRRPAAEAGCRNRSRRNPARIQLNLDLDVISKARCGRVSHRIAGRPFVGKRYPVCIDYRCPCGDVVMDVERVDRYGLPMFDRLGGYVVLSAVPLPRRAVEIVPLVIFDAARLGMRAVEKVPAVVLLAFSSTSACI